MRPYVFVSKYTHQVAVIMAPNQETAQIMLAKALAEQREGESTDGYDAMPEISEGCAVILVRPLDDITRVGVDAVNAEGTIFEYNGFTFQVTTPEPLQ